ncbi:MAG: transcription termination factor NusA [Acidobacteriota bacterium]
MANVLGQTIEQISKEKGIDPEIIQRALEDAMVAAAKKFFRTEEDLQARYDPETGMIDVFAVKIVLEEVLDETTEISLEDAREIDESFELGDYIEFPKPTVDLGRIAAQTAKQVIFQKVREAEREIIFEEFSDQIGQLVNGIVRRFEGRDIVLDIGRTEAILPFSEQSRNEQYKQGDRIRSVIIRVHRLSKGPQIVVSRTDPSLLIRLFEMEIPELYDGTVVIKNAVREGGERAKVAVASRDEAVDPVGACVGMKGSRINAVIRELKGDKIDIIQYSDDIVEYTANALNPAKIARVLIADPVEKVLEVIVPEDQLSLAIGKKGQNVRLASKLLGWQIDIKSEVEKKQEILSQMEGLGEVQAEGEAPEDVEVEAVGAGNLADLSGVGAKTRERLEEAGIRSIEDLASKSAQELATLPGIGEKSAEKLIAAAAAALALEEQSEKQAEPEQQET